MTQLKLAVIAGDGIGTEVVAEGLKVLDAVAPVAGLTVSPTETMAPTTTMPEMALVTLISGVWSAGVTRQITW